MVDETIPVLATDLDARPRYHVQPPANWLNDPNGPIQWEGQYHLFYQYNPAGPYHGAIHWGHAVSGDLAHWSHAPIALAPTPGGPDADGCWSGCTIDDNGVPTIMYTGVRKGSDGYTQTQCVAVGTDDLHTWRKAPHNPVIATPPVGLDLVGFRDPCVWQEGDSWWCVLGTGIKDRGGATLLYTSRDLHHWDYVGILYSRDQTLTEPVWTGPMWECPQFFPLGDKHVLLFGVHDGGRLCHTVCAIGTYTNRAFVPESIGRFDLGADYYAPSAMVDDRGRRLVWGWSWEGRSTSAQERAGWAGMLSLPRLLTLRPDGRLGIEPVPELSSLRGRHRSFGPIEVTPTSRDVLRGVQGDCLEIVAVFASGDAARYGLVLRRAPDGEEYTLISYDATARRLTIDRDHASTSTEVHRGIDRGPFELADGEALRLHVFLDRSIVEVYANGRACATERIYPSRADSLGLDLFARGGSVEVISVDVWELDASHGGSD